MLAGVTIPVLGAAAVAFGAFSLGAQTAPRSRSIEVPDRISCAACRIEAVSVIKLGGGTEKEGLIGSDPMLARDSRGRFLIAPSANGNDILVFSKDGRLEQTIGRKGKGPGEFEEIRRIWVGPGDSVHVFDWDRYTLFTPDFSVARTSGVGNLPWDAIFLRNGESIQQKNSAAQNALGYPMHLVSPTGQIRKSFGAERPTFEVRDGYASYRTLARSSLGGYWSALHTEYRIDRWDTTGVLLQSVRRSVEWFRPWQGPKRGGPQMFGIREDESGQLWILISPGPGKTIVEMIDLETGQLVTRTELPFHTIRFAGDVIWRLTENPAGEPVVEVMRLLLTSRR